MSEYPDMGMQSQLPPVGPATMMTGAEILALLETTAGDPLVTQRQHWFTFSRLLPLGNLTFGQQMYIVWTAHAISSRVLRMTSMYTQADVATRADEYNMMVLSQSSRAVLGKERESLITTRYQMVAPPAAKKKSLWDSILGK